VCAPRAKGGCEPFLDRVVRPLFVSCDQPGNTEEVPVTRAVERFQLLNGLGVRPHISIDPQLRAFV
jgi:hypothetical protein